MTLRSVELFAGAGGLGLGLERAGFRAVCAGEADRHACATYRAAFPGVRLLEGFLTGEEQLRPGMRQLDLLSGGPPCQPFSHAGDKLGQWDPRDGFPVFLRFVQRYQPRAVLMENVKGLLAERNAAYFEAILQSLRDARYTVEHRLLQAADYGVPQRRERVFVVGLLRRLGRTAEQDEGRFAWPEPTHSLEALVRAKYIEGTHDESLATRYEKAALRLLRRSEPRAGTKAHAKWQAAQEAAQLLPWMTVREALGGLVREYSLQVKNGRYRTSDYSIDAPSQPVAASWARDKPALVVRNLGAGDGLGAGPDDVAPTVPAKVAGQSGLAAMDANTTHEWTGSEGSSEPGRVHRRPSTILRRLSHAEVARLQSFPDEHPWRGPSTAIYRQIGNAVPPPLGEVLGLAIAATLGEK